MNDLLRTGGAPTSSSDPTRQALAEMLVEDTGTHFLDSGGAYGRHFQSNRAIPDFELVTPHLLRFAMTGETDGLVPSGSWWIETSHHAYHWLAERVTYAEELDALFERFVDWCDARGDDGGWLSYQALWADPTRLHDFLVDTLLELESEHIGIAAWYLDALEREVVTGLYGDGEPFVVNTYNGPDMVSQTLQYLYVEVDGRAFVLLSVHGGCDVRGGYGRPRFFEVEGECAIFDNARAYLEPEFEPSDPDSPTWYTDDGGYTWHSQTRGVLALHEYAASTDPCRRGDGVVFIDDGGNGYCPITGRRLEVWSG